MERAYATEVKEYIERQLDSEYGVQMSPKKFTAYSKARREVSKALGKSTKYTLEEFKVAIEIADKYFKNKGKTQIIEVIDTYGSMENLFNSKVNRHENAGIDKEFIPLIRRLNQLGAFTVSSCYDEKPTIKFASFIRLRKISCAMEQLGVHDNNYSVEWVKEYRYLYIKMTLKDKDIVRNINN